MANSISGSVLNQAGAGVNGITITWTGPTPGSTTTAGGGTWTTGVSLAPGTYIVTPSLAGREFQPAFQIVVIVASNIGSINFTTETVQAAGSSWLSVNANNFLRGSRSH
jgi:hypothetical protein